MCEFEDFKWRFDEIENFNFISDVILKLSIIMVRIDVDILDFLHFHSVLLSIALL